MQEIFMPHSRSRRIIIVSLLLTLQSISWLVLAVLTFVLGGLTVRNAVADHKPTAAALTSVFAVVGGGFFLITGLLVLLLIWGMRRQKSWFHWGSVVIEALLLFASLASLCGGIIWPLLAEGVLTIVILIYLSTISAVNH